MSESEARSDATSDATSLNPASDEPVSDTADDEYPLELASIRPSSPIGRSLQRVQLPPGSALPSLRRYLAALTRLASTATCSGVRPAAFVASISSRREALAWGPSPRRLFEYLGLRRYQPDAAAASRAV